MRFALRLLAATLLAASAALAQEPSKAPPEALPHAAYVQSLVARARELGLHSSLQWIRLGHYRPAANGGWKSDADGPLFFLARDGRRNPVTELDATIAAIFDPRQPDPVDGNKVEHPLCRFPARMAWLYKELRFDLQRVPQQKCEKLTEFLTRVAPTSATLVFSSYYMNNPASAFGHTFLRLNKAPRGLRGKKDELRDYAFNFAATVTTDNKLIYGIYGLLGGFHGDWTYQLYFYKVREYSEYESRDLWEYDLNLTNEQLAMLVAHLWEVGWTWFDYFYLDENCSFQILAALEAAAPERELTRHVDGAFVIPADTVRAVTRNEGFVHSIHYRPSIRVQFEARAAGLTEPDLDWVRALDRDQQTKLPEGFPPQQQAAIIDAALDYVDLRDAQALIHQTDEVATARKQRLLERRAEIKLPSPPLAIVPPYDKQPHRGHLTGRLGFGAGADPSGGAFLRYQVRGNFHDLADASPGYPELAMVEFFMARFRHNLPFENFVLEDAYLVRLRSLTPWTRFDKASSWHLRVGGTTLRDGACRGSTGDRPPTALEREGRCFAGELAGGSGLSFNLLGDRLTIYGTGDAALHGAAPIDGPFGLPLRLSAGPSLGFRLKLGERFTTNAVGNYWVHAERGFRRSWTATANARFHLSEQIALDVEARALNQDGRGRPASIEAAGMMLVYF